jgi:Zn-dependent protease
LSPDELFKVIVQIVVLLFAVSVHESAHGWVALRCGDTTARDLGRITLNPIRHMDLFGSVLLPAVLAFTGAPVFGWAKPVPVSLRGVENPRKANLLISAAGPASNLVVAVCFAAALFACRPLIAHSAREEVVYPLLLIAVYSVVVNVALALFNLVPIPPLDGFGVVESLAPASMIPALIWMRRYGFVLLMIVIFTGGLRILLGPAQRVLIHWLLGGIL